MKTILNTAELSRDDFGVGLPLVFLHGFPLNRHAWQKQIDTFQSSHRVIAPDFRGFGMSDTPSGETTMAQYAADVHELLQSLATGPVVLIGHSMGGYVALEFARQFPESLCGLVLVNTKATGDSAEVAAGRRGTAAQVRAQGVQIVIDAMAPMMLTEDNRDSLMMEQVRGLMLASKPEGVIGALLGMAGRADSTDLLARIEVPTLVVSGTDDRLMSPSESEKMASAIHGAQLSLIPNAGHLTAFEQPDKFNRILNAWLIKKERCES
jgi:3-oxoadipate enol-lactonase